MAVETDSVQTGSLAVIIADGLTVDVTISAVVLARSTIMYTSRNLDAGARLKRHVFRTEFVNATTVRFTRHESANATALTIEWTVTEYTAASIDQIQTGFIDCIATPTNVALSPDIVLNRSVPIISLDTNENRHAPDSSATAELTAVNNLAFVFDTAPTLGLYGVNYQVVQFAAGVCEVQSGTITASTVAATTTAVISTSAVAETLISHGGNQSSNTSSSEVRMLSEFRQNSDTQIEVERSLDGATRPLLAHYYVCRFPGAAVQSATVALGVAVVSSSPSLTGLGTDSFAWNAHWQNNSSTQAAGGYDDVFISQKLAVPPNSITIERSGSGILASSTYFILDATAAGGGGLELNIFHNHYQNQGIN